MELIPAKSWKLEFARSAEGDRYREILRRVSEEHKKKDREQDKKEHDEKQSELMDMVIMASVDDIADFTVTIDHYDEATYEALVENGELMDTLRKGRADMLDKAYELPDGRRVFESENGLKVFDENGGQLDPSVVTPEEIEDWRPKYEQFKSNTERLDQLATEREALTAYQVKLADAKERLDDGEISEQELKDLRQDLAKDMPDSVRSHLAPEFRSTDSAPAAQAQVAPDQITPRMPGGNLDMPTF